MFRILIFIKNLLSFQYIFQGILNSFNVQRKCFVFQNPFFHFFQIVNTYFGFQASTDWKDLSQSEVQLKPVKNVAPGDSNVGYIVMLVTDFSCWWQNHYVGDFFRW